MGEAKPSKAVTKPDEAQSDVQEIPRSPHVMHRPRPCPLFQHPFFSSPFPTFPVFGGTGMGMGMGMINHPFFNDPFFNDPFFNQPFPSQSGPRHRHPHDPRDREDREHRDYGDQYGRADYPDPRGTLISRFFNDDLPYPFFHPFAMFPHHAARSPAPRVVDPQDLQNVKPARYVETQGPWTTVRETIEPVTTNIGDGQFTYSASRSFSSNVPQSEWGGLFGGRRGREGKAIKEEQA